MHIKCHKEAIYILIICMNICTYMCVYDAIIHTDHEDFLETNVQIDREYYKNIQSDSFIYIAIEVDHGADCFGGRLKGFTSITGSTAVRFEAG